MWTKITFGLEYGGSNWLPWQWVVIGFIQVKYGISVYVENRTRKFPQKMAQIPYHRYNIKWNISTFYISCSIHSTSSSMHGTLPSFLFRPHLGLQLGKLRNKCIRIQQLIHENLLEQSTIVAKECIPIVQCWVGLIKLWIDQLSKHVLAYPPLKILGKITRQTTTSHIKSGRSTIKIQAILNHACLRGPPVVISACKCLFSAYLPSVIRFQNPSKKRKRGTEILKEKVVNH